jgi:hypothetical protein
MEPGDRSWAVVEPFCDVIDIYNGPAAFLDSITDIPHHAVLLYASSFCEQEVCNGGFDQFFSNSTGVLAPEALEGFIAIGQHEVADVLKEAMAALGSPYPRERNARHGVLQSIAKGHFQKVNRRFFDLIDKEAGGFTVAADNYASKFLIAPTN